VPRSQRQARQQQHRPADCFGGIDSTLGKEGVKAPLKQAVLGRSNGFFGKKFSGTIRKLSEICTPKKIFIFKNLIISLLKNIFKKSEKALAHPDFP
jgi:hypothetical protein